MDMILNRNEEINKITDFLNNFTKDKPSLYIYGDSGIGKSYTVHNIIKKMEYIILSIYKYSIDDLSSFINYKKKFIVLIEDVDYISDLSNLIKLIKKKIFPFPIICISNTLFDKKKKELLKISHKLEFKTPSFEEISLIYSQFMPNLEFQYLADLRKLRLILLLYEEGIRNIPQQNINSVVELLKITQYLYQNKVSFDDLFNQDGNILSMNWYENCIDTGIEPELYCKFLENFCLMGQIDKLFYQKQILILNDLTFFIKVGYNNWLLHNNTKNIKEIDFANIRFTKILTKYTTESNNFGFLQKCCSKLLVDKSTLFNLVMENKGLDLLDKTEKSRLKRFITIQKDL